MGGLLGGRNNAPAAGASGGSSGGFLNGPVIRLPSSRQVQKLYGFARPLVNGYLGQPFLPALQSGPVPFAANLAAPGPLGVVSG